LASGASCRTGSTGNLNPELVNASLTRSRDSFTAAWRERSTRRGHCRPEVFQSTPRPRGRGDEIRRVMVFLASCGHRHVHHSRRNSKRSDSPFATKRLSSCKSMIVSPQVRRDDKRIQASLELRTGFVIVSIFTFPFGRSPNRRIRPCLPWSIVLSKVHGVRKRTEKNYRITFTKQI